MPYTIQPGRYISPTSSSSALEIDPNAPGTILRTAFLLEATLNLVGGTWMVFNPKHFLSLLAASSSNVTPTALTWTQMSGALVYALSVPLFLGLPNSRRGVEMRVPTYYTLAAGEVGAVALALWKVVKEGDGCGWSRNSLLAMCACLVPPLAWRAYVVFARPEWIGRYREVSRKDD